LLSVGHPRRGEFIGQRNFGNGRIVLIEMPVGHSIPTKLLDRLIRRDLGREPVIIRASLSRNDKAKKGVFRKDLLMHAINDFGL
jgi:hypothetical protein